MCLAMCSQHAGTIRDIRVPVPFLDLQPRDTILCRKGNLGSRLDAQRPPHLYRDTCPLDVTETAPMKFSKKK